MANLFCFYVFLIAAIFMIEMVLRWAQVRKARESGLCITGALEMTSA